jgi:ABC-type microcin C transport system permease subunit YejE
MVLSACESGLCSICLSKNLTLRGTVLGVRVKIVFGIFYVQISIYLQSSAEEEVVNQFAVYRLLLLSATLFNFDLKRVLV